MATAATVTQSMRAKSQILLSERSRWQSGTRKSDGRAFWLMPSSDGRTCYYVAKDGEACTCRSGFHRGICGHMVAAREVQNESALADGWSPIPASEQASHAAFRARLAAAPTPKARRGYADLFPSDDLDDVLTSAF